jgi:hypothetical protein
MSASTAPKNIRLDISISFTNLKIQGIISLLVIIARDEPTQETPATAEPESG